MGKRDNGSHHCFSRFPRICSALSLVKYSGQASLGKKALGFLKRPQKRESFYAFPIKIHFRGNFRIRAISLQVHCRKNTTAICLFRFQYGTGKTGISSGSARCSFRKECSGNVRTSIPDWVYGQRQSHWTGIFLRISRSKCTLVHL